MDGGTPLKTRAFGDVFVEIDGSEVSVFPNARAVLSLSATDDLIDKLKSATAWIRDQQRREKEDETPMLPL